MAKEEKNLEISFLLDFYGDVLTDKQREVMEQYYNEDLSLAEIANNTNITRQGVRDAIKRGEATLLELEDKIGYAKRHRALHGGLERLELLTKTVRYLNDSSFSRSIVIDQNAQEMLAIINAIGKI